MNDGLPRIGPGQITGLDTTPGYRTVPIPLRVVDPKVSGWVTDLVSAGDLTQEEAMRLLFPEEAARIYDLDHNRNR